MVNTQMEETMNKIFVFFIVLTLLGFSVNCVHASFDSNHGTTPDEYLDCGVWAYDPVHIGSSVYGSAAVSCATAHATLRVVAGIRDSNNHYNSKEKYCYNASSCSISASLPYASGLNWKTDVSGYVGAWQAYYSTDWIYIP